jgi:hypothetical protein
MGMVQISKGARCLSVASLIWLTFCSAAFGVQPSGQQVTLGWNASPDPTVVGYYLYCGTTSGVYPKKINVGTNTTFTVSGLVAGSTNYFTTTSYNAAGVESSYVPEVTYIAPGVLTLMQNPASGIMRVQFPVAPGQSYQLQTSSDLKSWINLWLTPTETTNAWIEYDEPLTNAIPSRFYRLILY